MLEIPEDHCERHRLFEAIDGAFKTGDFAGLGVALRHAPLVRRAHAVRDRPRAPAGVCDLLKPRRVHLDLARCRSNPNYPDHGGFPAIIAALSTDRTDRLEIAQVLVNGGADPDMRGVNDWTPLHYAVAIRSVDAIRLLLAVGADPALETRIDDYTTALKEADNAGFEDGASLLRDAMAGRGSDGQ
ncbi:ankyrin repeat domain-containing protein [Mesorhizobium sp. M1060]|uniref:ankyrin repeat domain-containing protein n=1 Tax=unclassified Mesorhizobium TaxID=325217 RepID=UPI001FD886D1|nr:MULTISPECIES: ankyrin repeat domain-containing protein [unclassified Mesorhizobium]